MEKKTLASLVAGGLAVTGGLVLALLPSSNIEICDRQENCVEYTPQEYTDLKHELANKYQSATSTFTAEEYQVFVAVVDREIKDRGGVHIENVTSVGNIKEKIIQILNE